MKTILIIFSVLFSLSSFASQNEQLVLLEGVTHDGEVCEYSVYIMNNWEGQIAVFANGPSGNFRIELKSDEFQNGEFVAQYENTVLTYEEGVLNYFEPRAERDDVDEVVTITLANDNLLAPVSVSASQGPESLECSFQ